MDKMAELIALMDETKFNEKLTGKEVINHFRTRKDPKYLFDAEKADWMNDSIIIEEAEKVMNHDIFGWKIIVLILQPKPAVTMSGHGHFSGPSTGRAWLELMP